MALRMIEQYYIHTVAVLRAPLTPDPHNPDRGLRDWSNVTIAWSGTGWLSPEKMWHANSDDREQSEDSSLLFLPPDADIIDTDRVTVDGDLFQVLSFHSAGWTPRALHHIEVPLRRYNG